MRSARLNGTVAAIAAIAVLFTAAPARADGGSTVGTSTAVATSAGGSQITCRAEEHATWIVYPEGDAAASVGASTTCDNWVQLAGTLAASLVGDPTELAGGSCAVLVGKVCTVTDRWFATAPGSTHQYTHHTVVNAPLGYTWTVVPVYCVASGRRLTCDLTGFFRVY